MLKRGIACLYIILFNDTKVRIIFSIILLSRKSDIEAYDDFLDCKNVRTKAFKDISDISTLRNCFYTFVVFNVIILGVEKLKASGIMEKKLPKI